MGEGNESFDMTDYLTRHIYGGCVMQNAARLMSSGRVARGSVRSGMHAW